MADNDPMTATQKAENVFSNAVKIFLFGAPQNWKSEASEEIVELAGKEKVEEIFAPDSSLFNKKIADHKEFKDVATQGNHIDLKKGVRAEGTSLDSNQAVWILVADCGVLVARHQPTGLTVVTHCGRDSLHSLHSNTEKESVVDSTIDFFQNNLGGKISPADLSVYFIGGIGAENFSHPWNHPEKGGWNKKMVEHFKNSLGEGDWILGDEREGKLNIFEIAKRQFEIAGVPSQNIGRDDSETFSQKDGGGEFMWHSHRRGSKERNGILVIRKS